MGLLTNALSEGAKTKIERKGKLRKEINDLLRESQSKLAAYNVAGLLFVDDIKVKKFDFIVNSDRNEIEPNNQHKLDSVEETGHSLCGNDGEIHLIDNIKSVFKEINKELENYINSKNDSSDDDTITKIRLELIGPRGTCERCQRELGHFLSDLEGKYATDNVKLKLNTRYPKTISVKSGSDTEETYTQGKEETHKPNSNDKKDQFPYKYGNEEAVDGDSQKYEIEHFKIQSDKIKEMGGRTIKSKDGKKVDTDYHEEESKRAKADAKKQAEKHVEESTADNIIYDSKPDSDDITRHHYNQKYLDFYVEEYKNAMEKRLKEVAKKAIKDCYPQIPSDGGTWGEFNEKYKAKLKEAIVAKTKEVQKEALEKALVKANELGTEYAKNEEMDMSSIPEISIPTEKYDDYAEAYKNAFYEKFKEKYLSVFRDVRADIEARKKVKKQNPYVGNIKTIFSLMVKIVFDAIEEKESFLPDVEAKDDKYSSFEKYIKDSIAYNKIKNGNKFINTIWGDKRQERIERMVDVFFEVFANELNEQSSRCCTFYDFDFSEIKYCCNHLKDAMVSEMEDSFISEMEGDPVFSLN